MGNKRLKKIFTRFICVLGMTALVAVTGCDKKVSEEKVLSDVNDNIEEVEIEENIKEQTFEKDGITYKKILGTHLTLTYPLLKEASKKEKVNEGLIRNGSINSGFGNGLILQYSDDEIVVLRRVINIEPYFFDEVHSKTLFSTKQVSYITYRLYNARAYLYSSLYGCNREMETGLTPRDESVLGLSEPTQLIPVYLDDGKYYDIESQPVSIISTDFDGEYYYRLNDGSKLDRNVYLSIIFLIEESAEHSFRDTSVGVAEELAKAVLEAEIHYENGEIEKKYVGFKAYNDVNPDYYDVYNVELK